MGREDGEVGKIGEGGKVDGWGGKMVREGR